MKKSLFTVTMLMLLLVPLAGRVAAEKVEVYTGAVNDIKVEGHSSMPADKPILLYRNITYVPFRYMGGVLGKQVDWDSERRVISYGGEIPAVVGSSQPVGEMKLKQEKLMLYFHSVNDIVVDGVSRMPNPQQQPVFIYDSTTYVPFRYLAEISDKYVDWDAATRTISFSAQPFVQDDSGSDSNLSYYYRELRPQAQQLDDSIVGGVLLLQPGQGGAAALTSNIEIFKYDEAMGGNEIIFIPRYRNTTVTAYTAEFDNQWKIDTNKFDAEHTLATFSLPDFAVLHIIKIFPETIPNSVFLVSVPSKGVSAILDPYFSCKDGSLVVGKDFEVIN